MVNHKSKKTEKHLSRRYINQQIGRIKRVFKLLLEPFRQSDRDEVTRCLKTQGGLDACHLAFYKEGDLGKDGLWDNWRLEGPSFVWYFRGKPHVHVWVNVADTPKIELNSYQDSVGVMNQQATAGRISEPVRGRGSAVRG